MTLVVTIDGAHDSGMLPTSGVMESRWSNLRAAFSKAAAEIAEVRNGRDDQGAATPANFQVLTDEALVEFDRLVHLAMEFEGRDLRDVLDELDSLTDGGFEAVIAHLILYRAPQSLFQAAVDLGDALEKHEYFASAHWIMLRLSQAVPESYWPWFALGRMAFARNELHDAHKYLARSIAANGQFGWSYAHMYRTCSALGWRAEAGEYLERAVDLLPELRRSMAVDRLQLSSRLVWTKALEEALLDLIEAGPLPDGAVDVVLEVVNYTLLLAAYNKHSVESCIRTIEAIFYKNDKTSADFRLSPLLYMAAIMAETSDLQRAKRLLSEFERCLPETLNFEAAPHKFLRVIQSATDIFLKTVYVVDWPRSAQRNMFCLCLAEIQYSRFRNPGVARMLSEATVSDCDRGVRSPTDSLRLLAYSAEFRWFEVINVVTSYRKEDVAESPQLISSYVAALAAVTEGMPALSLAAVRQVLSLVRLATSPWEVMDNIIDKLHMMLNAAMSQLYDQLKVAAVAGDRDSALTTWEAGHAEACDLIEACEALLHTDPAPVRDRAAKGKALILSTSYLPQVYHYRAEQLAELLEAEDIPAPITNLHDTPILTLQLRALTARVVVLQRQPATFPVMRFIAWCRRMRIRILFDIDDQIFDSSVSPLPLNDYAGRIGRDTHVHLQFDCSYFRQAMVRCDAVIVSTEALRRQVEAVLGTPKPIYVRRNMIGEPLRAARLDAYEKRKRKLSDPGAPVEIFYGSGTKAHKAYFDETVTPALIDVLRARPNARVTLLGQFDLTDLPADVADRFACETQMLAYPEYLGRLAKADISIAPLNINPVTDAKSELKWFEAACVGTACVVSPTATYRETVEDGRHALFADSRQEWREALTRLIDEPALRRKLGEESARLIEQNYEIVRAAAPLIEAMGLSNEHRTSAPSRKRLLVVNTYFRPQSIGGATRIAEAYAQDLARRYGDRFEVFALCADAKHRSNSPYLVTALSQGKVTVLRCAVPMRDWADPIDPRVEEIAERIARDLAIDVVHAHSVQILTGSVVEGLVKAGAPVLLSLHDAWWLSEHQFLVDDAGKAFLPQPDYSELYETTCHRMSRGVRMRRRSHLARVLRQCARRLAVSESFADVYRKAGAPKIETLENGMTLPAQRPVRPRPAPGAPLRIGFIGGLSAHKGLRLLEDVVRSEQFGNLEFILVDHRFEQGYERESQWGASRVVIIGKAPQSRVAEVYSRFDILAAPSIWPESFGLVTREARAHGLAVIAGNRGDIGRGVGPKDGWVIDVCDDKEMRQLLRRLNADPQSGRLTPESPKVQSVEAAVDKLVEMLEQALA